MRIFLLRIVGSYTLCYLSLYTMGLFIVQSVLFFRCLFINVIFAYSETVGLYERYIFLQNYRISPEFFTLAIVFFLFFDSLL